MPSLDYNPYGFFSLKVKMKDGSRRSFSKSHEEMKTFHDKVSTFYSKNMHLNVQCMLKTCLVWTRSRMIQTYLPALELLPPEILASVKSHTLRISRCIS